MFSCEYCEIFKNTYFQKQLLTAASVHYVYKLQKWEMEKKAMIHKSDDLVSRIFTSSRSEVLKKIIPRKCIS